MGNHSCMQILIVIAISTVAIIVAPYLIADIPVLTGLAGVVGIAVMDGLVAGALDAAMQGLVVGVGLLDHFSWIEVLETAVSAGFANEFKALGKSLRVVTGFKETMIAMVKIIALHGAIAFEEQLAEVALGLRKTIDLKAVLMSMVTSAIDSSLDLELPSQAGSELNAFIDHSVEDAANMVVGDAIMGTHFDWQRVACQIIGDEAGDSLSHELNKVYGNHLTTHQSSKGAAIPTGSTTQENRKSEIAAAADGQSICERPEYLGKAANDRLYRDDFAFSVSVQSTSNKPATSTNGHDPKIPIRTPKADKPNPALMARPKPASKNFSGNSGLFHNTKRSMMASSVNLSAGAVAMAGQTAGQTAGHSQSFVPHSFVDELSLFLYNHKNNPFAYAIIMHSGNVMQALKTATPYFAASADFSTELDPLTAVSKASA